jgi:hypothetical protein
MPAEPALRWPHTKARPKDVAQADLSEPGISGRPEKSSAVPIHGKGSIIGPGPGGQGLVGKKRYARAPKYTTLDMMAADMHGKAVANSASYGPGPGWNLNPVPDFASIFPGRDPKGQRKLDDRASGDRMKANRPRAAGIMGFHGEPPKPTLRAEAKEQFFITSPRESQTKPRLYARVGYKGKP